MQDQTTRSPCEGADRDEVEIPEAAMIGCLLTDDGHVWTREELQRELRGSSVFFADALAGLQRAGLINVSELLVLPSRAARWMDRLPL